MADKKESVPFIQGTAHSENNNRSLEITGDKDNYIWQNFKDNQNFYDYINDIHLHEFIHETILDSKFKSIYMGKKILSEDGINIYMYVKDKLIESGDFMFYSSLQLFLSVTAILNININNIIYFVPIDEQIIFKHELGKMVNHRETKLF